MEGSFSLSNNFKQYIFLILEGERNRRIKGKILCQLNVTRFCKVQLSRKKCNLASDLIQTTILF